MLCRKDTVHGVLISLCEIQKIMLNPNTMILLNLYATAET